MQTNSTNWIPKELSWISFNERVLQEAQDPTVPLIERVRFLGIYSSNQDEFFKVKIAELKRTILIDEEKGVNSPAKGILKEALNRVRELSTVFDKTYQSLLKELADNKIYLLDETQISPEQRGFVKKYFKENVLKHISPVILSESVDLIAFLKDKYTYLAVEMTKKEQDPHYALIEIPTENVPRFVQIPTADRRKKVLMILDNIIRIGLDDIFRGLFDYDNISAYSI